MFDFLRNPITVMHDYTARADRAALRFLEAKAINGTITHEMVEQVAATVRRNPRELVDMIPDRRREGRYKKAVAGLRKAGLTNQDHDE
jgi:hypothetical protein